MVMPSHFLTARMGFSATGQVHGLLFKTLGGKFMEHLIRYGVLVSWFLATPVFAQANGLESARSQLHAGQLKDAKKTISTYLRKNPKNSEAWELSARIHLKMKETMLAVVEFGKAIEKATEPKPHLYVERANAMLALPIDREKYLDRAVRSLDDGMKKIGLNESMQKLAIELEIQRKNYSAALKRIEDVIPVADFKAEWLDKKIEVEKLALGNSN